MSEVERFYRVSELPLGTRVSDGARHGSIVRRAARLWVDAERKPPRVRWDGKIDSEAMTWQQLEAAVALARSVRS